MKRTTMKPNARYWSECLHRYLWYTGKERMFAGERRYIFEDAMGAMFQISDNTLAKLIRK